MWALFQTTVKNVTIAYVSECLVILPKNQGEASVSGFGSEQRLQQQSTPSCFAGHVCSMVVLWNVCFLSVQSSLFVSAWLWTTTLQYNYRTLDDISKCFNIWIKCFEIMFQRLEVFSWFFSMQIDMETKKQQNLLVLNAIIPKAYKKWSRNGKSQVFKKLYYWLLWILWLSILKDLLALTLQLQ